MHLLQKIYEDEKNLGSEVKGMLPLIKRVWAFIENRHVGWGSKDGKRRSFTSTRNLVLRRATSNDEQTGFIDTDVGAVRIDSDSFEGGLAICLNRIGNLVKEVADFRKGRSSATTALISILTCGCNSISDALKDLRAEKVSTDRI
jgi:hypothetical protein